MWRRRMLYLEGFYGQTVPIPDDRLYEQEEELWLKNNGDLVRIGVTKVGVLLMGGIETTEFFVGPGDRMEQGEEMVFFETFKAIRYVAVSYTHLRAHETKANLVCRLLLEKKKKQQSTK